MGKAEKVVVLGASTNPDRYAYKAAVALKSRGHNPVLVGLKEGEVNGMNIQTGTPEISDVDTVTLYIGPKRQPAIYDFVLSLNPRRVVFNPGTESDEFIQLVQKNGIEAQTACTLVMLSLDTF